MVELDSTTTVYITNQSHTHTKRPLRSDCILYDDDDEFIDSAQFRLQCVCDLIVCWGCGVGCCCCCCSLSTIATTTALFRHSSMS